MDLAFVEYKDLSSLKTSFEVPFEKQSVLFFVWESTSALKRNTNFSIESYYGAYVSFPYRRKSGLFGEIHLVAEYITHEIVSHEIQHFIQDWVSCNTLDNEKIATVAGWVTGTFWNEMKGKV